MHDPEYPRTPEQIARDKRKRAAVRQAQVEQRSITYIDDDGCEITAMPSGHVFRNPVD